MSSASVSVPADAAALAAFDAFTRRLVGWARSDARVLGIVLLGSGADRSRVDEWSDHDFAVVTMPGEQEALRADLGWLPDADRVVAVGREWHDGFKALYDDGHVVEFGVAGIDEFRGYPVAGGEIVYDAGGVAEALAAARAATRPRALTAADQAAAVLLVQLVVGVGRVRRGERLSGGQVIRSEAALTLLDLAVARRSADASRPDGFDGWRRFEQVDPELAARVDAVLSLPSSEAAARGLLDLAEEIVAPGWPAWPAEGARAVRDRLGW